VLFVTAPPAQLDGAAPTLAGITFNNAAAGYGITQGSGGSLTLQGGTANDGATVSVLAGDPQINAPVHLASNTAFSAVNSTTLTMMGPIDGTGSLTMSGAGKLYLNGANTFTGGLFVQSGKVVVSAANGLADGSNLTVGSAIPFSEPGPVAAAAVGTSQASASSASATKDLSHSAVAAVMSGPSINPLASIARRAAAAIFPNGPFPDLSQSVKDFWWRR
jgi:autotransporter-associated beta strand protein